MGHKTNAGHWSHDGAATSETRTQRRQSEDKHVLVGRKAVGAGESNKEHTRTRGVVETRGAAGVEV